MGGRGASSGSNSPSFGNSKKIEAHYKKHVKKQGEFGDISINEYLKKAQQFLSCNNSQILMKKATNGDILKFNPNTSEFIIVTKENIIRTYHILNPNIHGYKTNLEYWDSPNCEY